MIMKTNLLTGFILFLIVSNGFAQIPQSPDKVNSNGQRDGIWTILYNKDWKEPGKSDTAAYYRIVTFLDGKRRPVKDVDRAKMRGSIPYYGASGIIDYVNEHIFDEELILLGEDGENILSRNCRLAFRISGKTWVNNHAHVLKPDPDLHIGFLVDYLESLNYDRYNSGTAQPKLNKQTCIKIPIALPPTKAEQEAIAEALSDADALIESLRQLIAKKRQIKQGAMQDLLTGKKRLPGFQSKAGYKQTGRCQASCHFAF